MSLVFGPVASRRIGMSLGVDIVPKKVCSLDCVYCQAGRTTEKTVEIKKWLDLSGIIQEIEQALKQAPHVDYITFSGSGEPTLNSELGDIVASIKRITSIPVCVITNSTLLHLDQVRQNLMHADLVIPSLDAATQDTFRKINRPHCSLDIDAIIGGLKAFSAQYRGNVRLEVMIVKGINDTIDEIRAIKEIADVIAPHKIEINTVTRPSAESDTVSPGADFLLQAKQCLGKQAEIIGDFRHKGVVSTQKATEKDMIRLLNRRPCTMEQAAAGLAVDRKEAAALLERLLKTGVVYQEIKGDKMYYRFAG